MLNEMSKIYNSQIYILINLEEREHNNDYYVHGFLINVGNQSSRIEFGITSNVVVANTAVPSASFRCFTMANYICTDLV